MCKNDDDLPSDEEVVIPLLTKVLRKGAKGLIQEGFTVRLVKKVFDSVCDDMVKKKIEESISMKDFDMKDVLSTFYGRQLPKERFGPFRKHIANIIVGAVHATGYDYEDIGPFDVSIDDFEDGFNLIGINQVSGGSADDSFYVEGIAFKTMASRVHGFEEPEVVVKNPKILLLNTNDGNVIDILDKDVKCRPDVILSRQAIDDDAKKKLAKRGIYFGDLVAEDYLFHVKTATNATLISYNQDDFSSIRIGTCKRFRLKKFGNELFGVCSGCPRGKTITIVLRGDDQFIEEAQTYLDGLIPDVRRVMKEYALVAGGCALYVDLIRYLSEEANNANMNSKPIIKVFIKAFQRVLDKTCHNVGCHAVNNPSQKHTVAPGQGDTVWEPPSIKMAIIGLCYSSSML